MNNADASAECDRGLMEPSLERSTGRLVFHYARSERLWLKWKIVPNAHRASDELDITSQSARSQIECVGDEKPARIYVRTLTQIKCVREPDRVHEIIRRRSEEKFRLDLRVGDFHVPRREDKRRLVVFGDFTAKFESSTQFKFCVPVVIKRQGEHSCGELKIGVKKERILVQNFAFVTAL